MLSTNEYLTRLHRLGEEIKRRCESATYAESNDEQAKALLHFLGRADQIAKACFLVGSEGLGTPLYVLMRVLCEDLFISFWVGTSAANAKRYAEEVQSEWARVMLVNLEKGRAQFVQRSTGKDQTQTVAPDIKKRFVKTRTRIEEIANKTGLGKVYDVVYRFASPEVHGKTFGLPTGVNESGIRAALPGIISLLRAEILIADNFVAKRTTTPEQILSVLKLDKLAGP